MRERTEAMEAQPDHLHVYRDDHDIVHLPDHWSKEGVTDDKSSKSKKEPESNVDSSGFDLRPKYRKPKELTYHYLQ